jgi:aspartyl-tRNA(Asn)/glutamyl-tRNA(Gln) amidotransferase subunit A
MSAASIDLVNTTIAEMSELLRRREVSPVELTEATLDRIEKVAPQLGCFEPARAGPKAQSKLHSAHAS